MGQGEAGGGAKERRGLSYLYFRQTAHCSSVSVAKWVVSRCRYVRPLVLIIVKQCVTYWMC